MTDLELIASTTVDQLIRIKDRHLYIPDYERYEQEYGTEETMKYLKKV